MANNIVSAFAVTVFVGKNVDFNIIFYLDPNVLTPPSPRGEGGSRLLSAGKNAL